MPNYDGRLESLEATKKQILAELIAAHAMNKPVFQRIHDGLKIAKDVNNIPLNKANLATCINNVAAQIKDSGIQKPVLISLMDGALPFTAALQARLQELNYPFQYQTLQVRSYQGTESGNLTIDATLKVPVGCRNVIIIDDVCDTGKTYLKVKEWLLAQGAIDVKLAVLVNKPKPGRSEKANPNWSGVTIDPEEFIVGYGMDYYGEFRTAYKITVVDPATLPNPEELKIIQSIKPLNHQLIDCISSMRELSGAAAVSRHSMFSQGAVDVNPARANMPVARL